MKKIKMVALDLDGTTLNCAHNITDRTIETLRDISQSGVTVCIATGRSLDSSLLHYVHILGQTLLRLRKSFC
jgi:hydroxymethylpyrimidine pyrophosphatase-like HAD family hydrolase